MESVKIAQMCKSDPSINPIFCGVLPSDCLPRLSVRPAAYICNTDPKHKPGTHWVSIYIDHEGRGDYFDSYGRPPLEIFKRFMNDNCIEWNYSGKRLQAPLTSVCGQYCICFLNRRCRDYMLQNILSMFSSNLFENDEMVVNFVNECYDANTKMIEVEFIVNQISKTLKEEI